MINFNNLTIRGKIIGIILLTSAVTLMIGFSLVISYEIRSSKKELIAKSTVEARFIGEYCVIYLMVPNSTGIDNILKKVESIPTIEAVGVYDENNKLFANFIRSDQDQEMLFPEPETEIFNRFHKDQLEIFHPIYFKKQFYGTIYLRVSTEALSQKINNFVVLLLLLIIALVTLSYFVANRLQKIVSGPILDLANATKNISKGEDYSLMVQKKGNDEISVLFDGFNNMMDQIRFHEKDLRESKEKFHGMVMNLMEGFYSTTLDGKLLDYNAEFVRVLGLDPKENYTGIELPDFWLEPDKRKDYNEEFTKNGFIKNYIINAKKSDGEKIVVQVNSRLVNDPEGKPSRIEGTFMDITNRKRAEDELTKHREHLEELVKDRTKQLEEKNVELKRFYEATINREFRMKELKDEIDELKKQIGQKDNPNKK